MRRWAAGVQSVRSSVSAALGTPECEETCVCRTKEPRCEALGRGARSRCEHKSHFACLIFAWQGSLALMTQPLEPRLVASHVRRVCTAFRPAELAHKMSARPCAAR